MPPLPRLPDLHPEWFKPWETVRPDGCTLLQAIEELVSPGLRHVVATCLALDHVGRASPDYLLRTRDGLWQDVLNRLRLGLLRLRGRDVKQPEIVQDIQADLLDDVEPDFEKNYITCCGRTFGSVRVFDAAVLSVVVQQLPPVGESGSLERAARWMADNVTATSKRADSIERCRGEANVTDRVARAAWTQLDSRLKGTPGARKDRTAS